MYWHYHHMHRCSRATSRLFWFFVGAGTATWWHVHKDHAAWHAARHCGRDRIPQHAYPAPGALPPVDPTVPIAAASAATGPQGGTAPPPAPGTMDKWERWGWGHWGRGSWPGQEPNERWDRWGWNQRPQPHPNAGAATGFGAGAGAPARPEGAWGPPMPLPPQMEPPEKDVVQQATDTVRLFPFPLPHLCVRPSRARARACCCGRCAARGADADAGAGEHGC